MSRFPLHVQIISAMVIGAVAGLVLNLASVNGSLDRTLVLQLAAGGKWFGTVFLTLLKMVVVPLIFSSLVASITGLGKGEGLGRLGLYTVGYYLCTSLLAIITGMVLVNVIQPGAGLDYDALMGQAQAELETLGKSAPDVATVASQGAMGVLVDIVTRMIPANIVAAATKNGSVLSVIFFAICFGVAAVNSADEIRQKIDDLFRSIYEVMITLTNGILYVAPIGIGGYAFYVTASTGLSLAASLGWYMVTVALGLLIHGFVTMPLILMLVAKRSPVAFAKAMRDALLTAFSTASSAGTLPLTMQCATDKAQLPKRVVSFTLPLGATVNMDGTALYEAVAVLFVSQMIHPLDITQQAVVAVTALLASVGAAGIPHAGTVMMVIVMQAVGLPTDAVLVILAVDRVLDMGRTTINVWSDSVGAAVVTYLEGATDSHSADS